MRNRGNATGLVPADLATALPRLRRYARVLMGGWDGADDLVLATLAGAWAGERARPAELDLLTWLFALMHAAHRRDVHRHTKAGHGPPTVTADLCERVLRLPLEEREILLLVAVERLSYADTASLLDVPLATVLSTLVRARDHLRAMESPIVL